MHLHIKTDGRLESSTVTPTGPVFTPYNEEVFPQLHWGSSPTAPKPYPLKQYPLLDVPKSLRSSDFKGPDKTSLQVLTIPISALLSSIKLVTEPAPAIQANLTIHLEGVFPSLPLNNSRLNTHLSLHEGCSITSPRYYLHTLIHLKCSHHFTGLLDLEFDSNSKGKYNKIKRYPHPVQPLLDYMNWENRWVSNEPLEITIPAA